MILIYFLIKHDKVVTISLFHKVHVSQFRVVRSKDLVLMLLHLRLEFPKQYVHQSLKTVFILANSADPDKMPRNAVLYQDLHSITVC